MHSSNPKHRHLLIAPLILISIVLFSGMNQADLLASVNTQDNKNNEDNVSEVYDGIQIQVDKGGKIDKKEGVINLIRGAMLINSNGLVELTAGNIKLISIYGVFYVSYYGNKVSVASITAPVLLQNGENMILIPVGHMWSGNKLFNTRKKGLSEWLKSRSIKTIPFKFKRKQLMIVSKFPTMVSKTHQTLLHKIDVAIRQTLSFAQLPGARVRNIKQSAKESYEKMQILINAGNYDDARKILYHPLHKTHFQLSEGKKVLANLIANISDKPSLVGRFLEPLIEDERIWLISSVHPNLRTIVWGLNRPSLSYETLIEYIFILPKSDVLPIQLPNYILNSWKKDVKKTIDLAKNPDLLLNTLSNEIIEQIRKYIKDGYPSRAKNYTQILSEWKVEYAELMSEEIMNQINELERNEYLNIDKLLIEETSSKDRADITKENEEKQEKVTISEEEPNVVFTPDEVKSRAYILLKNAGALFTVETNIEAKNSSSAEIKNIVFETPNGDLPFEFTLDIIKNEVYNVINNGKVMPYRLSLESYVKWLKK